MEKVKRMIAMLSWANLNPESMIFLNRHISNKKVCLLALCPLNPGEKKKEQQDCILFINVPLPSTRLNTYVNAKNILDIYNATV